MLLAEIDPALKRTARENWYAELGHVPKLGQRLFDQPVDQGKRYVGLFTPPQDGKSYHVAKHVGPYLLVPDTHIWVVGPTYQDACKEFEYLYQDLAHLGILRGCRRKHFDIRGGNMHIETKLDSWIQVISAGLGRQRFRHGAAGDPVRPALGAGVVSPGSTSMPLARET